MHRGGSSSSALLVSASPLWNKSSELLGCVVTLTDITERKRAEVELARQAEDLARSNSDLRQFAYSASHDLREPLRQIAVFSELLQKKYEGKFGPEGAELIAHIVGSARRVEQLLTDLATYTEAADARRRTRRARTRTRSSAGSWPRSSGKSRKARRASSVNRCRYLTSTKSTWCSFSRI